MKSENSFLAPHAEVGSELAMFREGQPRRGGLANINQAADARVTLSPWRVFVFLFAVFLLCYASALITPYGFSDDYAFLTQRDRGETGLDTSVIAKGRPTYAVLLRFAFSHLSTVGDLRYLRLFGIIGIALLAWSFYRILVLNGWDASQAVFLSVVVFTLPSFQVYAAFTVTAFYPFAALVSGGALYLAEHAFVERRALYKAGLAVGAVLLAVMALTIHQSAGVFFWVLAAVVLFRPGATLSWVLRRFLWYSVLVFTGLLIGFAVYKLGMAIYGTADLGPLRSSLTPDIRGKVLWFLQEPLVNALNVVNLFPKRGLAWSVALFIGGGLGLYFRGGVGERLGKLVIALSLIPLSYLPNLVVAENWASYRTQLVLAPLIVVYAFFALWGYAWFLRRPVIEQFLTAGMGFAALSSSFLAAYNVTAYFATPQLLELAWIRTHLAQANLAQVRSIYVIGSRPQNTLAPAVRYDEFGMPSSAYPWCPWSMIYLSLQDMNAGRVSLPIETVPADGSIAPPPGALVLDMRKLLNSRRE